MDPAEAVAATTAVITLTLPVVAVAAAATRRLGALRPHVPTSRVGGIVVLCAALAGIGRSAPTSAAVAPPTARSAPKIGVEPDVEATGYAVRPGDSLWAIACRQLLSQGHDPSNSEVDRRWRLIYESNRDVIGGNPDLILPGTMLTIPEERA